MASENVLILGGAGFIGSHIVQRFIDEGTKVTVIDGFLPQTGANRKNLDGLISKIRLIDKKIEKVDISKIIGKFDVIVDSMGWTRHLEAFKNPQYDLELNVLSHLSYITEVKKGQKVIFLGSRGQYGKVFSGEIFEDTPFNPVDIQGINKVTGELLVKMYVKIGGFDAISLRFGNCFGEEMPKDGEDIGLVGLLIRDLIKKGETVVYGHNRRRQFVYAPDVAETIFMLSRRNFKGFEAYNFSGFNLKIEDFAKKLSKICGGVFKVKPSPSKIAAIEIGNASLNQEKLKKFLGGNIMLSNLDYAILRTCEDFKKT